MWRRRGKPPRRDFCVVVAGPHGERRRSAAPAPSSAACSLVGRQRPRSRRPARPRYHSATCALASVLPCKPAAGLAASALPPVAATQLVHGRACCLGRHGGRPARPAPLPAACVRREAQWNQSAHPAGTSARACFGRSTTGRQAASSLDTRHVECRSAAKNWAALVSAARSIPWLGAHGRHSSSCRQTSSLFCSPVWRQPAPPPMPQLPIHPSRQPAITRPWQGQRNSLQSRK